MTRIAVLLMTMLVAVAVAGRAHAASYYVSPGGDDSFAGTSPGAAWRTLQKVNNTELKPGDSVLLEGGQRFEGPLVPWGSGRKNAPVVYGSYGTGKATVSSQTNNILFLQNVSWVTVQGLVLTSEGVNEHIVISNPATTSAFVTLKNNLITNTGAFGIISPSLTDHDWTIQGNTISDTAECGITFRGANFKVIGNVIRDTGLHPSEASHGVYAKGPSAQVIGNLITNFSASGVSIRYQNSLVLGNTIIGGGVGVSYFQGLGAASGTSTIAYNRISGVNVAGMYLDDSSRESFVIANNTIQTTLGSGINLHRVKNLTFVNNVVTGTFNGYAAQLRKPSGAYVENHNLWFPGSGPLFNWEGAVRTLDQYRAASRQGAGDLAVDPQLDDALAPRAGSPVIDAGGPVRGLAYKSSCNGTPFSYCDRTPDLGAVEKKQPKRAKRRTVKR